MSRLIGGATGSQWPSMAVALSGGPDSMALAQLLAWLLSIEGRDNGRPPWAFVVDHRLRPESSAEAARKMGAAREARYELMLEAARQHGVQHLLLAHHADDQAETFLMRLSRASGIHGLACMPECTTRSAGKSVCGSHAWETQLVRPLLDIPKSSLYDVCRRCSLPWVEDPTNTNTAYQRAAIRDLMARHPSVVDDAQRVSAACRELSASLHAQEDALLDRAGLRFEAGTAVLRLSAFTDCASMDVMREALSKLVQKVSGRPYPPRSRGLSILLAKMKSGAMVRGRFALGGCTVGPVRGSGGELMQITRERP
eukprot:jgi/Tetstr1/460509/TSEL_005768.t1